MKLPFFSNLGAAEMFVCALVAIAFFSNEIVEGTRRLLDRCRRWFDG